MKSKFFLFLLVSILLLCTSARAQRPGSTTGIEVTAAFTDGDFADGTKKAVLGEFRKQLRLRSLPESGEHQLLWFLQAEKLDEGQNARIIASITRMLRLPEEVIELGADHEAFYLRQTPMDLPPEGKAVRQSFSRDWMGHFHEILDVDILVFRPSEMEQSISDYIDRLGSV
jgi:hypothetical protein